METALANGFRKAGSAIGRVRYAYRLSVASIVATIATLRQRGVKGVTEPFMLPAMSCRLVFFCEPFGKLIGLAEVLP